MAIGLLSFFPSILLATASVNKSFTPTSVPPGGISTLTVFLFNDAAAPLTGAALTDNLPAGVTIAGVPNASTTCASGIVTAKGYWRNHATPIRNDPTAGRRRG